MTEPLKISVVMSVYNGERFIKEAIDSVLSQTFRDFEFIIVNDGSTDTSDEIIKSYQDPRIRYILNSKNIGLTKSLNIGIEHSSGKYIARQDADDLSAKFRFQTEYDFLETHPGVAAVGTFTRAIDENGQHLYDIARNLTNDGLRHFQKGDTALTHGSLMLRRSALNEVGLYDEEIKKSQDYDLLLRLCEKFEIAIIPELLYEWRDWNSNISSTSLDRQKHYVKLARSKARQRHIEYHGKPDKSFNPDSPDFSIIMANYNNAQYIGEAIESALNQTYDNWELVIIDDASIDNSKCIVEQYLNDPRIRLIKNPVNIGYIGTLNRLLDEAHADILGILDSDDALTYDAVETMVKAHNTHPEAPFIYSQYMFCDSTLRATGVGDCTSVREGSSILAEDCANHFRTFKKDAAQHVGGFDERMWNAEDKDFMYKMEEFGSLVYVNHVLYFYRILPQSLSHGEKLLTSRATMAFARLEAYRRRKGSSIANLSRKEIASEVYFGLGLSVRKLLWCRIAAFSFAIIEIKVFGIRPLKRFARGLLGYRTYPRDTSG